MAIRRKCLSLQKEALDEVTLSVDIDIDDPPNADVRLAWNMGVSALCLDPVDDGSGEEPAIGDNIACQA